MGHYGRVLTAVALACATAVGGCATGATDTTSDNEPRQTTTAAALGFVDFRATHPQWLTRVHRRGTLQYPMSPPVGGDHSPFWQNCNGDVYPAPIANEHAVHSLEHGAVWVTYRPDLPADEVEALAARVRNRGYLFMSPYPGLDAPVSLQAWGYQLKVASAGDPQVDQFIQTFRIKASLEPGAPCTNGVTSTGMTPVEPPDAGSMP